MNERLRKLHQAGVSIWLDDLSRELLRSGKLAELINEDSVTGVTTNPTIFAAAFQDLSVYGDELAALKGVPIPEVIRRLMSVDVKAACQLFAPVYASSGGYDGRVSIEVEPGLAHETDLTVTQAAELRQLVGEPNVLIKIPATKAGLPAIRSTIAAGISVNVTLIFSLERYRAVMDAYILGLEDALAAGRDISTIHSVASFFVSRVDTEIDKRLEAIGTDAALALRGKAAVANARLAFAEYVDVFTTPRFEALKAKGANVQRPLWASTGVKNPAYPDTLYVSELITKPCVNTMPGATLAAYADHGEPGELISDTTTSFRPHAQQVMDDLASVGIDYDDVVDLLETEGVNKFIASWQDLVTSVTTAQQHI
ncbi:MAG: transaldolase [Propionibacteriaceae bacterium]|jgi:transaldolase|nr:transaldolase [Propionibacteriaceae bacterium]